MIENETNINEHARIIQYAVNTSKGYTIPIGIGRIYEDIGSIYKSYSEACIALEYRFVLFDSSVISFIDCKYSSSQYIYPSKTENLLLNSLILGDGDSILSNLHQFFDEITEERLNPSTLKQICMQLGIAILKRLKELNMPIHLIGIEDTHFFDMSRYETVNDFKNQLTTIIYKIINCLNENRKLISEFKLKKMVDKYLESNFSRNIGLADVAIEFGVTPNYFSSLFKKEVGENFVEYLTRYRIRIAKEILVQENIHISRVAEMVGYTDVKYFFRVFKKFEGITPKEYKQHTRLSFM